jgi:outer membrane protein assembly factor BamA
MLFFFRKHAFFILLLICSYAKAQNDTLDILVNPVTADTAFQGESKRFIPIPLIINTPETDWGFGMISTYFFKSKKNDVKLRTSNFESVLLYTLNKQRVVVLGGTIYFPSERFILNFHSSYSFFNDKFWGLGNSTENKNEERYAVEQFTFHPKLLVKIYNHFFAGVSYEVQDIIYFDYLNGGLFDTENILGKGRGVTSGAGLLLSWDSRNHAFYPTQGLSVSLTSTRFAKEIGSDFIFSDYSLDVRKFIDLKKNRVLAFQLQAMYKEGNVPVRYMALLGGSSIMRGYYSGRFMDKSLIAFQCEYRRHLFWRLGMSAFAGIGRVASSIKKYSLDGIKPAYGAGARLALSKKEKLNLRLDYGHGIKSHGVYLTLSEAF